MCSKSNDVFPKLLDQIPCDPPHQAARCSRAVAVADPTSLKSLLLGLLQLLSQMERSGSRRRRLDSGYNASGTPSEKQYPLVKDGKCY